MINAPAERVWEVITQPALVKQWQYGSDLYTDWQPGSSIRFVTVWDGKTFEQWGKVLEYKPVELIRYSLFAPRPGLEDKPENYFEMVYRLSSAGSHTQLEIMQEDNRPHATQEAEQGEENPVLKMLKQVAENN
jgi:uncharacterized protein YndB with AHSA1/START domain